MQKKINLYLDRAANFIAHHKGFMPLLAIGFIVMNLIFQFMPGLLWINEKNFFLHLGIIVAIVGFMLAWAL